jgi:hypothetical protein
VKLGFYPEGRNVRTMKAFEFSASKGTVWAQEGGITGVRRKVHYNIRVVVASKTLPEFVGIIYRNSLVQFREIHWYNLQEFFGIIYRNSLV